MTFLYRLLGGRQREQPVVDVGMQAERTAMSWQRTALGAGGFAALLMHLADGRAALLLPGAAGLLAALALLVGAERRYLATIRRVDRGSSPVAPVMLLVVTVLTVALSGASMTLLVLVGS